MSNELYSHTQPNGKISIDKASVATTIDSEKLIREAISHGKDNND